MLAPSLANALLIARAIGETLASSQKPLDILVTATASGLDVDVKGHGAFDNQQRLTLVHVALELDLARLSNHREVILTQRMPLIAMGKAVVAPPPGAFLQVTEAGEEILATRVCTQRRVKRIADLFSGIGTFALSFVSYDRLHRISIEVDRGRTSRSNAWVPSSTSFQLRQLMKAFASSAAASSFAAPFDARSR